MITYPSASPVPEPIRSPVFHSPAAEARRQRLSAAQAVANRRLPSWHCASTMSPTAPSPCSARISADSPRTSCARPSLTFRKKPGSFPGLSLKTCATGTPRPAMPPSAMPCRQRRPLSSKTCPRACIPLSPRAVRIFPAARSNVWLLPGPWSKRPSSTSSTTVSLPWIPRQMPPCAGPCQQS